MLAVSFWSIYLLAFGLPTEIPESLQEKRRLEEMRAAGKYELKIKKVDRKKKMDKDALPLMIQQRNRKERQVASMMKMLMMEEMVQRTVRLW